MPLLYKYISICCHSLEAYCFVSTLEDNKANIKHLSKVLAELIKVLSSTLELNPYHAEFLKWNNPLSIYGTFHYHF